jgi:exonuclease SbcC
MDKLDNAYNILCGLRKNDRVIGIISHISELKNRIENQIVVKKTDLGSSITIID